MYGGDAYQQDYQRQQWKKGAEEAKQAKKARRDEEGRQKEARTYYNGDSTTAIEELKNDPIVKSFVYVGRGIYKLGKGAVEVGKITGNTLINAYKISTGNVEVINTAEDGKTQVVIKNSESNNTTSNNNSLTTTTTTKIPALITHKTIELKDQNNEVIIKLQEKTINTSLKFKLNKQHIIEIKQYREITFPDTMNGEKNFQFVLYTPNGSRPATTNAAFFTLDYNDDGQMIKLSLPNVPRPSSNPFYPVLTIFKGNLCSLPVISGHYKHLVEKIYENHGTVEISHIDPDYSLECLG